MTFQGIVGLRALNFFELIAELKKTLIFTHP
jgi:hypothetical protein